MVRQEVYSVRIPERTRAISMPKRRPETTMERDMARLAGGARSPTRGSMSCGVTVETAVMKESATKTGNDLVMQRPSHWIDVNMVVQKYDLGRLTSVAVNHTSIKTYARLRKTSPRGQRKRRPAA